MTLLAFHLGDASADVLVEHGAVVRVTRESLSAGGPPLATFVDGTWHIGSQRLECITCEGAVRLEVEGEEGLARLGPFPDFTLLGEQLACAEGPLARYAPARGCWQLAPRPEEGLLPARGWKDEIGAAIALARKLVARAERRHGGRRVLE